MNIASIRAREILDSRGNPTIEADVELDNGVVGSAKVPSGASTGAHEALELRDGDERRFHGKGVLRAVDNVHTKILPVVKGMSVDDLRAIDRAMIDADGTENKAEFGANAILSVSLAAARAAAHAVKKPLYAYLAEHYGFSTDKYALPVPMCNVLNGGEHADSGLSVQEFMICPVGAPSFAEGLRMAAEVFQTLKGLLASDGYTIAVGDEGGFAPRIENSDAAFSYLQSAVEKAGYVVGQDVAFACDVAASSFYHADTYKYTFEGTEVAREDLLAIYDAWISTYSLISIEDPLDEDDWAGWHTAFEQLGDKVQIVADDFTVTNTARLKRAITEEAANSILIKVNQIGTLSETMEAVKMAYDGGWTAFLSHRSGETSDTFIADLAVATGCKQMKSGALSRSERVAKYNRLLRIEEDLLGAGVSTSYGWVR